MESTIKSVLFISVLELLCTMLKLLQSLLKLSLVHACPVVCCVEAVPRFAEVLASLAELRAGVAILHCSHPPCLLPHFMNVFLHFV